jgi:hypothetical protein
LEVDKRGGVLACGVVSEEGNVKVAEVLGLCEKADSPPLSVEEALRFQRVPLTAPTIIERVSMMKKTERTVMQREALISRTLLPACPVATSSPE